MLDKADQPTLADLAEKGSNVRVEDEGPLLVGDPDRQRVQRTVLAALRPEPIAEVDAREVSTFAQTCSANERILCVSTHHFKAARVGDADASA
jgi:hypothetical protein